MPDAEKSRKAAGVAKIGFGDEGRHTGITPVNAVAPTEAAMGGSLVSQQWVMTVVHSSKPTAHVSRSESLERWSAQASGRADRAQLAGRRPFKAATRFYSMRSLELVPGVTTPDGRAARSDRLTEITGVAAERASARRCQRSTVWFCDRSE